MNDIAMYIGVISLLAILTYMKVSKFFGSLIIMLTGMGILYVEPDNGWIGFIIMALGFLMIIYSFLGKKHGTDEEKRG